MKRAYDIAKKNAHFAQTEYPTYAETCYKAVHIPTMSNKPIQCTVCWRYRGETRGGLRNHQRQAGCSNILRARNASRTKKDNLGRSLSDEIERQPSPDLSIHPTNFPEISLPKRARVSLEEVPDEGDSPPQLSRSQFTSVDFDGAGAVASDVEKKESVFQQYKQEKEIRGEEAWSPFKSHAEWQLARWLMLSGISQGDIDSFAKLPIVSDYCNQVRAYVT